MKYIVTGMHRSGTTHLGQMLKLGNPGLGLLHEPLNAQLGISGVRCWYASEKLLFDAYGMNVNDFFDYIFSLRFKERFFARAPKDNFFRIVGRQVLGGEFRRSIHEVRQSSKGIIVKDPFILRLVGKSSVFGVTSLVVYKHPLANLYSVGNQNWNLKRTEFEEEVWDYITVFPECLKGLFSIEEMMFLKLWNYMHVELLQKNPENLNIISHEDYCTYPREVVDYLTSIGCLECPEMAMKFVSDTMLQERTDRKSGLHDFKRNANAISKSWKKAFSKSQIIAVDEYCGDVLELLSQRKVEF